mmetsp:Transcript_32641/g.47742  ORF Transcript_32641/g.47742 Transcript_32641/m.47742 type:complete len:92 (-) Transcript_32641:68-343(-)
MKSAPTGKAINLQHHMCTHNITQVTKKLLCALGNQYNYKAWYCCSFPAHLLRKTIENILYHGNVRTQTQVFLQQPVSAFVNFQLFSAISAP